MGNTNLNTKQDFDFEQLENIYESIAKLNNNFKCFTILIITKTINGEMARRNTKIILL